jgi:uncharacterized protein
MFFTWMGISLIVGIAMAMALSVLLTRRHSQTVFLLPNDYGLHFEAVTFTTSDHLRLSGWWLPFNNAAPTIVFLHGYGGSRDPDLKYAPAIHHAGFNILMFDFRAHGSSEGNITTLGALEVRDAIAAINFVKLRISTKIGLLGFSMGGRVGLLTAAEDARVTSIVSDGGPLRLSTALLEHMKEKNIPPVLREILTWMILLGGSIRTGINLFLSDPINKKDQLASKNVMFIHAELDLFTKLSDLQDITQILGENGKSLIIPGVHHRETDTNNFNEYISEIIAFFVTTLKS